MRNWKLLQKRLQVHFKNEHLLIQAMTHSSFKSLDPERKYGDNQRLEMLGDTVLNTAVTEWIFHHFTGLREGGLTELRNHAVSNRILTQVARRLEVYSFLLCEPAGWNSKIPDKVLADTLEAIIGALFLDQGYAAAAEAVYVWLEPVLSSLAQKETGADICWGRLQEYFARQQQPLPVSRWRRYGEIFRAKVVQGLQVLGTGEGESKKEAQRNASRDAWQRLSQQVATPKNPA